MLIAFLFFAASISAQDVNTQLKEADNLEKQLKEGDALKKYKQIAATYPDNITAFVKCAELSCSSGARQKDKNAKLTLYNEAEGCADKALSLDSNSADAYYVKALVAAKMVEAETENKKIAEDIKQMKLYADKALSINPDHAKANYLEGKWHYEMLSLNWLKKAALKTVYRGLPKADIDSAIHYMDKCRQLDQYFVSNYLDLAKAYKYKERPAQAIEVLTKMVRLPTRTADDVALKEEGKKMLEEMQ
jgi:hypothetical protein